MSLYAHEYLLKGSPLEIQQSLVIVERCGGEQLRTDPDGTVHVNVPPARGFLYQHQAAKLSHVIVNRDPYK